MIKHSASKDEQYLEQEVLSYHANPFIESLPRIIDKSDFFKRMTCLPLYDEQLRKAPDHLRAHVITDGFDFFLPLPRHHCLHTCIDRMIRRGYLARNPIPSPLYWRLVDQRIRLLKSDLEPISTLNQRTLRRTVAGVSDLTSALTGVSGGGKSLALRMDLAHIPQVKEHGEYHGFNLNIRQVSWLWIEAAHKGSPNDLCISLFRALDELLGTKYETIFGRGTLAVMMSHVARLVSLHAVGLLIIDEIQELSNIKSGGDKALVGFFLRLTNTIKIPVLMVGTYKGQAMLQQQMRHIRRSTGIGLPSWEPLSRKLREWDAFVRVLWRYQYTKTPTELTLELSDTLFEECQGIPDFAVKLYFLCQDRLIATNDGRSREKITVGTIRTVATEYLGAAHSLLQALRLKDKQKLEHMDDVRLPTLAEMAEQRRNAYEIVLGFGETAYQDRHPKPVNLIEGVDRNSDHEVCLLQSDVADAPSIKKSSKIAELLGSDVDSPDRAYESLAKAGLIKSAGEFEMGASA